jgi:predicted PurR-regulated permease PerM
MSDADAKIAPPPPDEAAARPSGGFPRWAAIGIFLLLAIQAIAFARAFLTPVVLALLLTLVFSPLRRFLGRLGLPAGVAAMLIVGALLFGVAVAVLTLAAPAGRWVDEAPMIGRELREKFAEMRDATEGMREVADQVDEIAGGGEAVPGEEVARVRVDQPGVVGKLALTAPTILAQMLFTLVLLFFLLASGDMFYEKIVHVMPTFRDKRRAIRIAHDIERKLSRYFFTITLINAGLGLAIGLAMWALAMPNPALFAVIAAVLNFIPYVGAIAGVAIAFVVGMVNLSHIGDALIVAGAYLALTSIEGQLVTPYFVGRSLRLNTVVVFISVTFWAWVWSVVGMLVATPLLVMVRTLSDHIPALNTLGSFLSDRGDERVETDDDEDGETGVPGPS